MGRPRCANESYRVYRVNRRACVIEWNAGRHGRLRPTGGALLTRWCSCRRFARDHQHVAGERRPPRWTLPACAHGRRPVWDQRPPGTLQRCRSSRRPCPAKADTRTLSDVRTRSCPTGLDYGRRCSRGLAHWQPDSAQCPRPRGYCSARTCAHPTPRPVAAVQHQQRQQHRQQTRGGHTHRQAGSAQVARPLHRGRARTTLRLVLVESFN